MAQLWGGRFTKRQISLFIILMHPLHLIRNFTNRISREALHMLQCWKTGNSYKGGERRTYCELKRDPK